MKVIKYKEEHYPLSFKDKEFFVRGEGWKMASKNNIIEIPDLSDNKDLRDSLKYNFKETFEFISDNYNTIKDYSEKYGIHITMCQLGCEREQDYSMLKQNLLLKHSLKYPELLSYINKIGELNEIFMNKISEKNGNFYSDKIKFEKYDKYSLVNFDFFIQTWSVNIANYMSNDKTFIDDVISSLYSEDISIRDGLNKLVENLGDDLDKSLTFNDYLENIELPIQEQVENYDKRAKILHIDKKIEENISI